MNASIVIDASTALKWYIEEEYCNQARLILEYLQKENVILLAPSIMHLEVMNAIYAAIISKRISASDGHLAIKSFLMLSFTIKHIRDNKEYQSVFDIAQKYKLSVYDSSYIFLAETENCNFYTADQKLYNKLHRAKPFVKWIEEFK